MDWKIQFLQDQGIPGKKTSGRCMPPKALESVWPCEGSDFTGWVGLIYFHMHFVTGFVTCFPLYKQIWGPGSSTESQINTLGLQLLGASLMLSSAARECWR